MPLIIAVPDLAPHRVAEPVELVDIAPTILGLVDVPAPPTMQGHDLRPLLDGAPEELGPAFASAGTKHMVVAWPNKLIADLRFGTSELYDLVRDPRERENLADDRPEGVRALTGELHAWLDSLADADDDPYASALYRGRLADRSAAPELATLMLDEQAPPAMRTEAARLLASLADADVVPSLSRAARSPVSEVATEANISLGWLGQRRVRPALSQAIDEGPFERRVRAAIGLGRLSDPAAVPVLIEALPDTSLDIHLRFEAVRLLGLGHDERAVDPLLDLLEDMRLRRRAVLALGRLGDPRAFEPLVDQLAHARHSTVRESSARALGQLGDRRAVGALVRAAATDRLPSAGESLVRLGAVGHAAGGLDVGPRGRGQGLRHCRSLRPGDEDSQFLNRTFCETAAPRVVLRLALPAAVRDATEVVVLLRARRVDEGYAAEVHASLGEHALPPVHVDGEWAEHRFTVPSSALAPSITFDIEGGARLALDHVLLLPAPAAADAGTR